MLSTMLAKMSRECSGGIIYDVAESVEDLDRAWDIIDSAVDDAAEAALKAFAERLREKVREQLTR
jgi:hypothetical protein